MKLKTLTSLLVITSLVGALSFSGAGLAIAQEVGEEEDLTAPMVTSVFATDVTGSSARLVIEVSEPATAAISYAPSTGELTDNPSIIGSIDISSTSTSVMLFSLSPGSTYYYFVDVTDAAGNTSRSLTQSFNTTDGSGDDTTPPEVLSAFAESITDTSAIIALQLTETAAAVVWYATAEPVLENSPSATVSTTETSIPLSGLSPETTYYFLVTVSDGAGNTSTSSTHSFTTEIATSTPTTTDELMVLAAIPSDITESSAVITLEISKPATSMIWYATAEPVMDNSPASVGPTSETSFSLGGLTASTTYFFLATVSDDLGNHSTSSTHSFTTLMGTTTDDGGGEEDDEEEQEEVAPPSSPVSVTSGGSRRPSSRQVAGAFTGIGLPLTGAVSTSQYIFSQNLGIGMASQDVAMLQRRLTAEGVYQGPETGFFGPLTTEAVRRYQAQKGISPTGFVGPLTRAELNRANQNIQSRSALLAEIQRRLSVIVAAAGNLIAERVEAATMPAITPAPIAPAGADGTATSTQPVVDDQDGADAVTPATTPATNNGMRSAPPMGE